MWMIVGVLHPRMGNLVVGNEGVYRKFLVVHLVCAGLVAVFRADELNYMYRITAASPFIVCFIVSFYLAGQLLFWHEVAK